MRKSMLTTALAGVMTFGLATAAVAEIKIGATLSETGPASFLGDPEAKTLKMLVDAINAKGGIKGEKISLVLYDDGGDPNKAKTFATRLVEDDQVVAIIGGTTTGTSMAIIPVAEDAKVPFISLAGAIEIVDPVKPFTFKTPHTDKMACAKIFDDMKKRGFTKVGMISGTDGFGASMRNQCLAVAKAQEIEILADETYGPRDADMTPQLTNVRGKAGIQAILNPGFGQGPAIVTRNYAQLGITLPLYQSHGVASNAFIELAGAKAAEGVRLPGTALLVGDLLEANDPQKPVVTAYKTAYEKAFNTPVSTFGGYAHDALLILTDAIGRAGSTKPGAIRDAIEGTKGLVGTTGTYTMSKTDHLGVASLGFGILIAMVLANEAKITGGPDGIRVEDPGFRAALAALGIEMSNPQFWYAFNGLVLFVGAWLALNLHDSPTGRALRALHGSEVAARTVGVDVARYKLAAFVISAVYASLSGSLLALQNRMITPDVAGFIHSIEMVTMAVLGGAGSVIGAILGAGVLTTLPQVLTVFQDYEHLMLGLIMMLVMIFMRDGLLPSVLRLVRGRGE